jgi:hypothetical protein
LPSGTSAQEGFPGSRAVRRPLLDPRLRNSTVLAAYRQASGKAGKTYETAAFEKARKQAIKLLCTDLEKEAQASCDRGYKVIQDSEALMSGKTLADADRASLVKTLEEGKKLIEAGMSLFDRSYQVSEHLFDTTRYGQALKMARGKLLELKK